MSRRVMICAGEASGDLYGALLSRAIKDIWPGTEIIGIGGSRMKSEGVRLFATASGTFGLTETIRHWGQIARSFLKARAALLGQTPDILVLIDFPDFNIALAKKAKSVGIPVLYYVSPQVWAWRAGRIKKIASRADRMAVLFPFEVDEYKETGLRCEFVGHPVAELAVLNESKEAIKRKLGLDPERQVISLLPGSRATEIRRHQALIIELAGRIKREFPYAQIIVPLAAGTEAAFDAPDYVNIVIGRTTEALGCSEASAIASGTATLEAAFLNVPMVVFYRLSPVSMFFARAFVNVEFISLVNILSGKRVVAELIQREATSDNIFGELRKTLKDSEYRENMIKNLQKIRDIFRGKSPSKLVALMTGELAGWNSTGVC